MKDCTWSLMSVVDNVQETNSETCQIKIIKMKEHRCPCSGSEVWLRAKEKV